MNIVLYSFTKRKNSTAVPSSGGTTVTCVLKEGTSLNSPSFLLSQPSLDTNYVSAFGKYYYVDNITLENNTLWRLDCSIDVLASYKADILAAKAYIEYSNVYNDRIVDNRPAKLVGTQVMSASGAAYTGIDTTGGSFIVVVSGSETSGAYKINSDPKYLIGDLYQWWNNFDTTDIMQSLKNLALYIVSGDVSQNIRSVRWIPWTVSGGSTSTIFLGMYNTGMTGSKVESSYRGFNSSITIPWPTTTRWRRASGYMSASLYLPFIGSISYPVEQLNGEAGLSISGCVDEATGQISLTVSGTSSGKILGVYGADTGVDIPIGGAGFTPRAAATALGAGAAMIATGGAAAVGAIEAGAAATALAAEAGNMASLSPVGSCVGSVSGKSACGLSLLPRLDICYWDISEDVSALSDTIGCPTFKTGTIGSYTYVRGSQVSINTSARGAIKDRINSYIQGGIFIE